MLTRVEEAERAAMISGLYAQPSKTPYINRIVLHNSFKWSRIISSSLVLALPYITINIVYAFFAGLDYQNRPDLAATGIMFIAALILIGLWMYSALKNFIDRLSDIVVNTRPVVWFSCLSLAPAIPFLRYIVIGNSTQATSALLKESALYFLASMLVSVTIVMALVYILERIGVNDIVKIVLAMFVTSIPYVVGLLLNLY